MTSSAVRSAATEGSHRLHQRYAGSSTPRSGQRGCPLLRRCLWLASGALRASGHDRRRRVAVTRGVRSGVLSLVTIVRVSMEDRYR
jgi:hypothetical protein